MKRAVVVTRALCTPFVCAAAIAASVSGQSAQPPVFRAGVDLVNIGVTVTDRKGGLVDRLERDDFEIYEDGKKQTLRYFATGSPDSSDSAAPAMHLGLALDVSESMGDDIAFTKTAAVKFLNTLLEARDITLVDFDTEVRTVRYAQDDFARMIERIRLSKARGWTALYDAIGVYLDDAGGQDGRKVLLLYTDGGDTSSSLSFGELVDLLKTSDVTVYVVGELEHLPPSAKAQTRMLLQQVADVTGGKAYFPALTKELDRIYDQILSEIRAQYTLGYVSTNERTDGAWRKVEIKVRARSADGHDLRARSRRGYYAPFKKP